MTPPHSQPEPHPDPTRAPDASGNGAADNSRPTPPNVGTPPADPATLRLAQWAQLRELLLGGEQRRLNDLESAVNDPLRYTNDIIRVLPEAVAVRSKQDDKLSKALAPTIDSAIKESVRRDPHSLVEAISPVMGPAIRKSINDALQGLIQSFNTTLEDSFNLKWRIESWRTGKSYAEVVMLHKLAYRVEQVFLIHRDAGLLLKHVHADPAKLQDADMVSGMFTAIRDFAKDSFGVADGGSMDSMRVGDLTVWTETGPKCLLAIVFRGNAGPDLRTRMQDAFMQIQLDLGPELAAFEGDIGPFERAGEPMRSLLISKQRVEQEKKRSFPFFTLIAVIVLGLLLWWAYVSWRASNRWNGFLDALKSEPGLVLTGVTKVDGKQIVNVLQDANAKDPDVILDEYEVNRETVEIKREPFQSLYPPYVLKRAEKVLKPEPGVTLSFTSGVLAAEGRARHQWVIRARREAPRIFGVSGYDESKLVDTDAVKLLEIKRRVEAVSLRFIFAQTELAAGQDDELNALTQHLLDLHLAATDAGVEYQVQFVGHTDMTGTEERNTRLSRDRADRLIAIMALRGVPTAGLNAVGVGYGQPDAPGRGERESQRNRRVSFRVLFLEQPEWVDLGER